MTEQAQMFILTQSFIHKYTHSIDCFPSFSTSGIEPDLAVADSAPRPNSMDDVALTQALDLLARQPFPEGGGEGGQAEGGGRGGGTGVFMSLFSHSRRK